MAKVQIPSMGESVTEATLLRWLQPEGAIVSTDTPLCELETDKANVELPSPVGGKLKQQKAEGQKVAIGEVIAEIDESAKGTAKKETPATTAKPAESAPVSPPQAASASHELSSFSPSVRRVAQEHHIDPSHVTGSGPRGRVTKEDVLEFVEKQKQPATTPKSTPAKEKMEAPAFRPPTLSASPQENVRREPMSKIRTKIAERLVSVKTSTAMLTTFNEINMSALLALREKYKERFQKVYGTSLGFMSFFARACTLALQEFQVVNASIDGTDIVYHDFVNLGIAVSTDRGLVVPVLRNVEYLNFGQIELEIKRVATAARDGKLSLQELSGGTFTITNGGVFGSLMSTPILNPPQSAILGMHAIQKRPVNINDRIELAPMMYVALSYDHRLIDGKDSVSFLVRVKEYLEDPSRLMLGV